MYVDVVCFALIGILHAVASYNLSRVTMSNNMRRASGD